MVVVAVVAVVATITVPDDTVEDDLGLHMVSSSSSSSSSHMM